MLFIKFEGWFQCRLATDPDPVDERRGVSGYIKALPGEPDLDRIIRFHDPLVKRDFGPDVGVKISKVAIDDVVNPKHPLLGAKVDLLNQPMFYGYNGIVGDDGEEAIVPFDLCISQGDFRLQRAYADKAEFPFRDLIAKNGIIPAPLENAEATNIYDFPLRLAARAKELDMKLKQLEAENSNDEVTKEVLRRRIKFLTEKPVGGRPPAAHRYFNSRMEWVIPLTTQFALKDPGKFLEREPTNAPWAAYLWMGAWDPDTHCGYTAGRLAINWAT